MFRHGGWLFVLSMAASGACMDSGRLLVGMLDAGDDLEDAAGPEGGMPSNDIVRLSEIMYHPVLENSDADDHEFIEIYNPGSSALRLDGWRLDGVVQFVFPRGTTLADHGFLVVAKNKARLLADVPGYGLGSEAVVGDYTGELDNGGGTIRLSRADDSEVEQVTYGDEPPWPMAPDAFGAKEGFFDSGDPRLPFSKHRYRGHSLERVSYDLPADDVANWAPSALDGMTPGRPNGVAGARPIIVLEPVTAQAMGGSQAITPADRVRVRAILSVPGPKKPSVETFIQFSRGALQPVRTTTVPLTMNGAGFEALLPIRPENSVVRYRIVDGATIISPRPSDANKWHAYFVGPNAPATGKALHLFIDPKSWALMSSNIDDPATRKTGRVPEPTPSALMHGWDGCKPNPDWDKRVSAVFVADETVYDVRVRYQGSPYNRWHGVPFVTPFTGVTSGDVPAVALSWSLSFPQYSRYAGRSEVHLNKITQSCPGGLTTQVVPRLYERAGIPAVKVFGFHRVYVNGGYYHYMMDREHEDEDLLRRVFGKGMPVGELWKNVGYDEEQGPWGIGDGRNITAFCGFSAKERYDATYERVNFGWRAGADEIRDLVEGLNVARNADRQAGDPANSAQRTFLMDRFDVDELLSYKAIINWANAWDDYWQNYFLYRRPDGKFWVLPYDFDYLMQIPRHDPANPYHVDATRSFYIGEENAPDTRVCCIASEKRWNHLFDSVFKTFRKEYNQKVLSLDATLLSPASVSKEIDDVLATSTFDQAEARKAPGGAGCEEDYLLQADAMKVFAAERHAFVRLGADLKD